ncbi:LysM peptidoglycan-binding domain-containing protein [Fundicoccus culcitae]|uniref:Peptidoglycan hydrolase n=1 Tax=Fundicoccus culcitae TaxID=2969821 RepID=A0ABY5P6M6_9LACT|nr:LysM peptidoglycan-binding domain-containing protein [Fundicoccus culcitae]UUX34386.1 LysM peptidoglycan-binding domain-containing protein [Fundicoccus culcitae]
MSLKRQDIINSKNALKKQHYTKQLMTTMNKSLVLLSAGVVLSQAAAIPTSVEANDSVFTTRVSKSTFLDTISEHARTIAAQNDLYASVMIAQAALETGWGNSTLAQAPYNNLFGIKGNYNGNSVSMNTLEDDGSGSYYGIVDSFKVYPSIAESLADYADVLIGTGSEWRANFYAGALYSNTTSYQDATAHLTGRYATDTSYGTKLNAIISQNNLTQYDMVRNTTPSTPEVPDTDTTAPEVPDNNTTTPTTGSTYRVVAGDTYWALAKRFGLTVAALQQANNATNSNLSIGMSLNIPASGSNQGGNEATTPVETPKPEETPKPTTPTPEETPSTPDTTNTYVVKAGDTYWALSKRFGTSVADLLSLNATTSSALRVGQTIKVTGQTTTTPPKESTNENNNANNGNNSGTQPTANAYTVKAGDTYWALAQRFGVSVASLQQLNGTTSSALRVGQSLKVPSSTVANNANSNSNSNPNSNGANNSHSSNTNQQESSNNVTAGSYVVQAGDTYWALAKRYNTTVAALQSLNNAKNSNLAIGQSLVVPGQTATVTSSTVETMSTLAANETPAEVETIKENITEVEVTEVITNESDAEKEVISETITELDVPEVETPTEVTTPTEVVEEIIEPAEEETTVSQHQVKAGETLYSIAQHYQVSVSELIANNGGTLIRIGQVITW